MLNASLLNDIPPEILGIIFGYLPVSDILRLRLVHRAFNEVVSDQPHLQYKCELAAAGLSDNPGTHETLFDRRASLHRYRSRFDTLKPVGSSRLPLGTATTYCGQRVSGDVHAVYITSTRTFHFHRLPSVSGSHPMETWSFQLTFTPGHFVIHPSLDLIAIVECPSNLVHLKSMKTGDPHPLSVNGCIKDDMRALHVYRFSGNLAISISNHTLAAKIDHRIVVWNWRTGAKILDRDDLRPHSMAFIGDDCLLVTQDLGSSAQKRAPTLKLLLLDSSVGRGSPATPREVTLLCDPHFRGTWARILAEEGSYNSFSEGMGLHIPFHPDPSQRVLALMFLVHGTIFGKAQGICVVHSETLLRLARETGEGVIGWDIWGDYTVAPEMDDVPGAIGYPIYSISGSRFVRIDTAPAREWVNVRMYDLSHWTRQQFEVGAERHEGSGGKVKCRRIEGVLDSPQDTWKITYPSISQDGLVFLGLDYEHGGGQAHTVAGVFHFW